MSSQHAKRSIWVVAAAAMLVFAVGAVPAAAKKGGGSGGPPDPVVGMTCEDYYGFSTPVEWLGDDTFELTMLEPGYPCVDIEASAGTWVVDVEVGSAREVSVQLRSSVPGDWCWSEHVSIDTVLELAAPASEPGACPIPGIQGKERIPDDDAPLAFTVYVGGKRLREPVVVTVTLPGG